MTIRLNGWHRLWIVICVLFLVFGGLTVQANLHRPPQDLVWMFVQLGLLPPALLYAMGWAVAWIIRGFKDAGR